MNKLIINVEPYYILGFLLAVPLAIPSPPFYWFAFLFVFYVVIFSLRNKFKTDFLTLSVFLLLFILQIISICISLMKNSAVSVIPAIGSLITVFFYISGIVVNRSKCFFLGFEQGAIFVSVFICFLFLYLSAYKNGVMLFVTPEYRLWADSYLPDWPNYIACILSAAIFLRYIRLKHVDFWLIVLIFSALITTSRVAILACVMFFILFLWDNKKIGLSVVALSMVLFFFFSPSIDDRLIDRITKTSDREYLFSELFYAWLRAPILGHGTVSVTYLIPDSPYKSFHNSYLEILVKNGLIGIFLYLLLLSLFMFKLFTRSFLSISGKKHHLFMLFMFFLISSLFQNYLKHPHLVILFSVICLSKNSCNRNKKQAI